MDKRNNANMQAVIKRKFYLLHKEISKVKNGYCNNKARKTNMIERK